MVAGAAFLGRLGPNRAKNTAPVNFLAPERGFLWSPAGAAFLGRLGPNRARNTAPVNFLAQREVFCAAFLGRLGPNRAKNTAPVNFLAPERGLLWCPAGAAFLGHVRKVVM